MKRLVFLSGMFFIYSFSFAQKDTTAVLKVMNEMRQSLVNKDSISLQKLLHPAVAFGHSNGWVQTKSEVFRDMSSGFLVYQRFDVQSTEISINGQYATVKERFDVEGERGGTAFKLKLFVLHLWLKDKNQWKLLMRQSTKL